MSFPLPITTAYGAFIASYSEHGLVELDWPGTGRLPRNASGEKTIPSRIRTWHRLTEAALKKALAGKPMGKLPPLDWTDKTEFQKSVWRVMQAIPPGRTMSYGEVAAKIKRPKAVRAVGGACGANPIPVLVPCHRILAANRKIGGFSGGLDWKHRLLTCEGIQPSS